MTTILTFNWPVSGYSPLPATTLTTSYDSNLTCSVRTNEAANVAWNEDGTFVGINHNNFKALAGNYKGALASD